MRGLALVLAVGLAVAGCGDDEGTETAATTAPAPAPADEGFAYGTGECPPEEKPQQRPTSFPDAPQRCIEDGVDYRAEVVTSEGAFTFDLLEDDAPGTVNNFVVLARSGWFDGDDFHRVVAGFVNQAGDPVGDPPGTGGPGYTIPDELEGTTRWKSSPSNQPDRASTTKLLTVPGASASSRSNVNAPSEVTTSAR